MRTAHALVPNSVKTLTRVWKRLRLGTGLKDRYAFLFSFYEQRINVGPAALDLLCSRAFRVASQETEVDLVRVTVADLGLGEKCKLSEIYHTAKERGLQLCPIEAGPQLRLQYADQPEGEQLLIGMEPVVMNGFSWIFSIERPEKCCSLSTTFDNCKHCRFVPADGFLFVQSVHT